MKKIFYKLICEWKYAVVPVILGVIIVGVQLVIYSSKPLEWIAAFGGVLGGLGTVCAVILTNRALTYTKEDNERKLIQEKYIKVKMSVENLINNIYQVVNEIECDQKFGKEALLTISESFFRVETDFSKHVIDNHRVFHKLRDIYNMLLKKMSASDYIDDLLEIFKFHNNLDRETEMIFVYFVALQDYERVKLMTDYSLIGRETLSALTLNYVMGVLTNISERKKYLKMVELFCKVEKSCLKVGIFYMSQKQVKEFNSIANDNGCEIQLKVPLVFDPFANTIIK